MDRMDRRLLAALQKDCRQSIAELAHQVALSPSACHRRIKQLEEKGVVQGYVARVDGKKLGYRIEFFVEVSLHRQSEEALGDFEEAVKQIPEILECHLMTGQADFLLRVAAADTEGYERFHRNRIAQLPGVSRIETNLVLRTVSRRNGYPVDAT